MPEEFRCFGPPGTGKTTWLSKQIDEASKAFGSSAVMVASFTKTAAEELVARKIPVDSERVGTLHAFAYRALGKPGIADLDENLKKFNEGQPEVGMISSQEGIVDDPHGLFPESATMADRQFHEYQRLRAQMINSKSWPMDVAAFAERWEDFKKQENLMDFTDLIERAYLDVDLPIVAACGFFDEVQDFSPLELALVRKWGEGLVKLILAGDDDQCIYSFKGSDPKAFLYPEISQDHKLYLRQSWRLPRKIQELSQKLISHVKLREPKQFYPRKEDGVVEFEPFRHTQAQEIAQEAADYAGQGKTVQILTSCGYLLRDIIRALRVAGELYWNRYRPTAAEWNPLKGNARRILNYLIADVNTHGKFAHSQTWATAWDWIQVLDAKRAGLKRGAKKLVEEKAKVDGIRDQEILPDEWEALIGIYPTRDWNWLPERIMTSRRPSFAYTFQVCRAHGPQKLLEDPRITIGTIHSVKGGEADVVFLSPDLSMAGMRSYSNKETEDAVIRTFYVGMTRARERLILLEPENDDQTFMWHKYGIGKGL